SMEPAPGSATGMIDQLVPFHLAATMAEIEPPTAVPLVVLGHEMRRKPPTTAGTDMIAHLVPSQCSASTDADVAVAKLPTAKQLVSLGQATSNTPGCGGPAGLALGTTAHDVAAPAGPVDVSVTPATS